MSNSAILSRIYLVHTQLSQNQRQSITRSYQGSCVLSTVVGSLVVSRGNLSTCMLVYTSDLASAGSCIAMVCLGRLQVHLLYMALRTLSMNSCDVVSRMFQCSMLCTLNHEECLHYQSRLRVLIAFIFLESIFDAEMFSLLHHMIDIKCKGLHPSLLNEIRAGWLQLDIGTDNHDGMMGCGWTGNWNATSALEKKRENSSESNTWFHLLVGVPTGKQLLFYCT
jgi:hypothetical protein